MRVVAFGFLLIATLLIGYSGQAWWLIVIPALISGFFESSYKRAFIDSFVCGFMIWAVVALIQDASAGFRISHRVAGVFHLPFGFLAVVMTGLIAGLVLGSAAMCGVSLRNLLPSRHIPGGR